VTIRRAKGSVLYKDNIGVHRIDGDCAELPAACPHSFVSRELACSRKSIRWELLSSDAARNDCCVGREAERTFWAQEIYDLVVLTIIVTIVNALKSALEYEYNAERRTIQREFKIACEVQSRLLPSMTPDNLRLDFGYFYQPAREVGGDDYDFIPFDAERMGLAVGDISGKGLLSALQMASLQGLVRMNLQNTYVQFFLLRSILATWLVCRVILQSVLFLS
jgi:hypothetical protein